MRAGRFDRRIDLVKKVPWRDGEGGETVDYAPIASSVPASVRVLSGKEMLTAGQVSPDWDVICLIRFREDVEPQDAFVYQGRHHDIYSISEIGRREGLEIRAKVRAGQ